MRAKSHLEETLALQIRAAQLPEPERELMFARPRRWRFDFAYPDIKLAVEIEGGVWINGHHNRGQGFIDDCEKYNAATLAGWRVLRYTKESLMDLTAIGQIKQVFDNGD